MYVPTRKEELVNRGGWILFWAMAGLFVWVLSDGLAAGRRLTAIHEHSQTCRMCRHNTTAQDPLVFDIRRVPGVENQ